MPTGKPIITVHDDYVDSGHMERDAAVQLLAWLTNQDNRQDLGRTGKTIKHFNDNAHLDCIHISTDDNGRVFVQSDCSGSLAIYAGAEHEGVYFWLEDADVGGTCHEFSTNAGGILDQVQSTNDWEQLTAHLAACDFPIPAEPHGLSTKRRKG